MALQIYKWKVGCEFRQVATGRVLKGPIMVVSSDILPVQEVDPPSKGTCMSKVFGEWYGNPEIRDFLNRQKAWLPHSGLFGLTPESGQHQVPESHQEVGWFKRLPGWEVFDLMGVM